jgi:hypothetical protein
VHQRRAVDDDDDADDVDDDDDAGVGAEREPAHSPARSASPMLPGAPASATAAAAVVAVAVAGGGGGGGSQRADDADDVLEGQVIRRVCSEGTL